jgi:LysM repeat protein
MQRILALGSILLVLGVLTVACEEDDGDDGRPTEIVTLTHTVTLATDEADPEEISQLPSPSPTQTGAANVTPTAGSSRTPSPTFPPTNTPQPTRVEVTAAPANPQPTDPPQPVVVRVEEGDTCGSIAVAHGLELAGGSAAIREANGLNAGCTNLVIGQEIVVPPATPTATPPGYAETATTEWTKIPEGLRNATLWAVNTLCPEEGDTLESMALKSNTTRQRICELNPLPDGIDCRGCNFAADGPNARCAPAPIISEFSCLNVPGPTHTPTFTATFSGEETATPIPTYIAPQGVRPVNGERVLPGAVMLVWSSSGQLKANEYYKVSITNETTGELMAIELTQKTSLILPADWHPAPGQEVTIGWAVEVVDRSVPDQHVSKSGLSRVYRFVWEG